MMPAAVVVCFLDLRIMSSSCIALVWWLVLSLPKVAELLYVGMGGLLCR